MTIYSVSVISGFSTSRLLAERNGALYYQHLKHTSTKNALCHIVFAMCLDTMGFDAYFCILDKVEL